MNEAQTRFNKIDPKLRDAGWGIVPGSKILVEQSAYIAPGRITTTGNKNPKKADYILEYKGMKLAVIEAKSDEKDVSEGVAQAKLYADALKIRYTYSTNGDEIWFIDMGVKNSRGEYIIDSKEHDIDHFPTPQDLWQMTFPEENPWRDKFNLCALNRSGGRQQECAGGCGQAEKPYIADDGNRNGKDLYGFPDLLETDTNEVEYKRC